MSVTSFDKPQTFETEAGSVTITGFSSQDPVERCIKGYVRDENDPRIIHPLEYDLNGRAKSARSELNLDLQNSNEAAVIELVKKERRRS